MNKDSRACNHCLYHMDTMKFIVCPCAECKVMGGDNPPITCASSIKDRAGKVRIRYKERGR